MATSRMLRVAAVALLTATALMLWQQPALEIVALLDGPHRAGGGEATRAEEDPRRFPPAPLRSLPAPLRATARSVEWPLVDGPIDTAAITLSIDNQASKDKADVPIPEVEEDKVVQQGLDSTVSAKNEHHSTEQQEDKEVALCRQLLLTWECMTPDVCLAAHTVHELLLWTPLRARQGCATLFNQWPCSERDACVDPSAAGKYVPGDIVARSQLQAEGQKPRPYVPPEQRTPTPFPPPFVCQASNGANVTIYPMSMGAVREMYLGEQRRTLFQRTTAFTDLYPKRPQKTLQHKSLKTFGLNEEIFAVLNMASSKFGLTTKRWGWDCLRHYEYGAYGVLPYFVDLPVAPSRSVSALPRSQLLAVLSMPGLSHNGALWALKEGSNITTKNGDLVQGTPPCSYGGKPHSFDGGAHVECTHPGTVNESLFQPAEYLAAATMFYTYAETYLTTASMAASMLQRAGVPHARKVLLILLQQNNEFNQMSLHHGLVDLGLDVTAFPRIEGHYKRKRKDVPNIEHLDRHRYNLLRYHGNGYMWGLRVFDDDRRLQQEDIFKLLEHKSFDAVIFAGFNGRRPESTYLFKQVTMSYSADKIIFVQTTDAPIPVGVLNEWSNANLYGTFFMREVEDSYAQCPSPVPVPAFDPALLLSRSPYVVQGGVDPSRKKLPRPPPSVHGARRRQRGPARRIQLGRSVHSRTAPVDSLGHAGPHCDAVPTQRVLPVGAGAQGEPLPRLPAAGRLPGAQRVDRADSVRPARRPAVPSDPRRIMVYPCDHLVVDGSLVDPESVPIRGAECVRAGAWCTRPAARSDARQLRPRFWPRRRARILFNTHNRR